MVSLERYLRIRDSRRLLTGGETIPGDRLPALNCVIETNLRNR